MSPHGEIRTTAVQILRLSKPCVAVARIDERGLQWFRRWPRNLPDVGEVRASQRGESLPLRHPTEEVGKSRRNKGLFADPSLTLCSTLVEHPAYTAPANPCQFFPVSNPWLDPARRSAGPSAAEVFESLPLGSAALAFVRQGGLWRRDTYELPTMGCSQGKPGLKREGGCRRDGDRRK